MRFVCVHADILCAGLLQTDFIETWGEGRPNLRPRRPPREYLGEYTSRGKPKIPPADRLLIDPCHKARKNPSDNADLGFQAVVTYNGGLDPLVANDFNFI